ncbi:MAG: hypothetical protein PWP10_2729 [Clostridiales bacterium]|jgi:DNA-binding helix-hairpin-helix protein with protein kinase domain|nr:hypothetical protein [Clostridiales bacterium]
MIVRSSNCGIELADDPFARGGEGCVYDVIGKPELVAKIYHPAGRTNARLRKIKAMLDHPPQVSTKNQTTWPIDILNDLSGSFIGFLMPRIKNVTKIDILYSYDNRARHQWKWYIQTAQNLCAAVNSVHECGHCIGDMNPANICVEESTGLVTLVDTDSYHINSPDGKIYPCVVCMPAYVPSELHKLMRIDGFDLRSTTLSTFSQQTDLFALAIHIFALLMNGCHPYACTVPDGLSASHFNLIKNIERGYFPFVKSADQVGIPKYAPYLTILPERLKKLIIRVFTAGSANPELRPSCQEWYDALEELENQLVICTVNGKHQYSQQESSCPWCKIEHSMRVLTSQGEVKLRNSYIKPVKATAQPVAGATSTCPVNKPAVSVRNSRQFWYSGFGEILSYFITFVIWAIFNVLAQLGIAAILPSGVWWGWLINYLLFGIIPFLPTWALYFWGESSLPLSSPASWAAEILIGYGKWLALIVYGVVAAVIYWDSGLLNTVFGVIFVCSPILLVMKFLPDFAGE